MPVKIAPSLLAADFSCLREDVERVAPVSDWLHLDVMDGHFVPNISFGIPVIEAIRGVTDLYFDCHLMTTNPDAYLPELAKAGVNLVTVHIEAVPDPSRALQRARDNGLDFGLVINPRTPFDAVAPFVEKCDIVVVMSVEPGHGGQSFIPTALPKIEAAREWVESRGLRADIQVDGGITPENAGQAISAGATVLVAGTAVFRADDPLAAVEALRRAAETDE
ncbi:MAG TPA: ribulose-phosphate 3-epimerase [Acidimicrobiia bacterium]|nr:ribulose-phosphate 3-epimerase [Acidimicrobiia bacterium]